MIDAEAIRELGLSESIRAANEGLGKFTARALPNNYHLHDLERYLPNRRRARGTMTTSHMDGFKSYVTSHAEAGACVFMDADDMQAVAVLNLGTPAAPGHADSRAILKAAKTAPFTALAEILRRPSLTQREAAEFIEDWRSEIVCGHPGVADDPSQVIQIGHAVAAVRAITIDAARKSESKVGQLSAERTEFESIAATSAASPIPTEILFTCVPYHGLKSRTFVLRLGILTTGDKPSITLRMVAGEKHRQEMAEEMAAAVRGAFGEGIPVLLGSYEAKA